MGRGLSARQRRWITCGVIASGLLLYFYIAAGIGLHVYFYDDDLMNLYRAIDESPGWRLLTANLTPFTSVNRPLGALYYRAVFAVAGFDPYPFRAVTYGFLVFNGGLLYLFARRLSNSREIGVLAVLIGCYHHRFVDIYGNNGTIYDILCTTFYLLALLAWFRWRSLWLTILFYIPALNAKEMAASFPLVLLAYELIYYPPVRSVRGVARWLLRGNLTVLVTGIITLFAARAKTASTSAFYANSAYQPVINWHNFMASAGHWFDEMCYTREASFPPWLVVSTWVALLTIAIASRRKYLLFAFAYLFLTPLPVSFIPQRGFFVMYLPWVGWSLFFSGLLIEGRDFLYRRAWHRPPIPGGAWQPERIATFLGTLAVLVALNLADPYYSITAIAAEDRPMRRAYEALQALHPTIPNDSKILMLNDPLPPDSYMLLFLVRLVYGHQVDLVRAKQDATRRSLDPAQYNYIWDYQDNHFIELYAGPVKNKG